MYLLTIIIKSVREKSAFAINYNWDNFSLSLLVFQFFLSGIAIPLFYVWIEIITIFSVMQFWLVAGDIFNSRQAKRTFPLIIAGGSIAAILSGYSIKPFVTYFNSSKFNISNYWIPYSKCNYSNIFKSAHNNPKRNK